MTIVVVGESPAMMGKWSWEVTADARGVPDGYGEVEYEAKVAQRHGTDDTR